jgi:hypothetical protein
MSASRSHAAASGGIGPPQDANFSSAFSRCSVALFDLKS